MVIVLSLISGKCFHFVVCCGHLYVTVSLSVLAPAILSEVVIYALQKILINFSGVRPGQQTKVNFLCQMPFLLSSQQNQISEDTEH